MRTGTKTLPFCLTHMEQFREGKLSGDCKLGCLSRVSPPNEQLLQLFQSTNESCLAI